MFKGSGRFLKVVNESLGRHKRRRVDIVPEMKFSGRARFQLDWVLGVLSQDVWTPLSLWINVRCPDSRQIQTTIAIENCQDVGRLRRVVALSAILEFNSCDLIHNTTVDFHRKTGFLEIFCQKGTIPTEKRPSLFLAMRNLAGPDKLTKRGFLPFPNR